MEYIKNIEIKNFKSIRHVIVDDCRRVNVFIGYPNVGKSNLLEALGLYCIPSLYNNDEFFKFDDICRVKHFSELFFNQDYRNKTTVNFNDEFELQLEIINGQTLEINFGTSKGLGKSIQTNYRGYLKFTAENHDMNLRQQNSSVIIPDKRTDFRIPKISVKKYTFLNDTSVNRANSRLGLSVPYGNNLLEVLQRETSLRKDLAEILQEYSLKLLLDTSSGSIMLIKEIDNSTVLRIPYHQIADTLKRLIFFKAAIQSNSDSILLFEEPEAHMFPPYIAKFTSDIMFDKQKNQYFIATHSPFVLNDFMEDMEKDELSIYLVGLKNGETTVKRLTDDDITEVYKYGVDLFFNLEDYLKDGVS